MLLLLAAVHCGVLLLKRRRIIWLFDGFRIVLLSKHLFRVDMRVAVDREGERLASDCVYGASNV